MKIDFVIPWVDGGDKAWLEDKAKHLQEDMDIDAAGNRYRDWDNLKYWFRGVEKYAPWVNKIFFVTWGHVPKWLNCKHEKIVVVNHKDYIPEKYLPTFSANPIELNLHRIENLSEHFVYFNDDMFLVGECKKSDFFGDDGLPCDMFVEEPPTYVKKDVFNSIIVNDLIMINRNFDRQEVLKKYKNKVYNFKYGKGYVKNKLFSAMKRHEFFGIDFSHLPQAYLKTIFNRVWDENQDELDSVCCNKFRSINDVNQYVIKYYQLLTGQFKPYNWKKLGVVYQLNDSSDNNIEYAINDILDKRVRIICLNDSNVANFEATRNAINNAFEKLLPERCSYELLCN